jgi:benzoyl-CoA reductase subunit C
MYFPDEIIHAAGALPVTLLGNDQPISMADRHLMTNACHPLRSTFDALLRGQYDFLDGVAGLLVCDQVRFFMEVWQLDHPFPFFHQMWRPYKLDAANRPFLVGELQRLLSALENFTGNQITPAALCRSIELYNESRTMMRLLNGLRRNNPGVLSAGAMTEIVTSSLLIPREEHNQLLRELLAGLEGLEPVTQNRPKVVAIGHLCDSVDRELLDLIQNEGLLVIDDDFFTGKRQYAQDVTVDGDPVQALADFYINSVPCTTYHFADSWTGCNTSYSPYADYVIDMVKTGGAAGVVLLRLMYCDPVDLEYVLLKERLQEEQIPYLALFTDAGLDSPEAVRTRIQAFSESLLFDPKGVKGC